MKVPACLFVLVHHCPKPEEYIHLLGFRKETNSKMDGKPAAYPSSYPPTPPPPQYQQYDNVGQYADPHQNPAPAAAAAAMDPTSMNYSYGVPAPAAPAAPPPPAQQQQPVPGYPPEPGHHPHNPNSLYLFFCFSNYSSLFCFLRIDYIV